MKRFFCLLFVLLLLPVISLSDLPDISGLSFDELVQLRDQIQFAMWNSEQWQEVTVPAGTWKIGEDIPVGHWSIKMSGHGYTIVWYCEKVDKLGQPVCFGAQYIHKDVASEDFQAFDEEYAHVIDFDMEEGWFLYFTDPVILSPYTGKPDLGFK